MGHIKIKQSFMTDRRILRLSKRLDEDRFTTAGRVIALWLWALDNAPDGDLGVDFEEFVGEVTGSNHAGKDLIADLMVAGIVFDMDEATQGEHLGYMLSDWDNDDWALSVYWEPNKED